MGEEALDDRLASVWDGHSDLARLTIEHYLAEGSTFTTTAVWSLLLRMYEIGFSWAEDLITTLWPTRSPDAIKILAHANSPPKTHPMLNLWVQTIADAGPIEARDRLFRVLHGLHQSADDGLDLSTLRSMFLSPYTDDDLGGYLDSSVCVGPSKTGFSVKVISQTGFANRTHFGLSIFSKPEWTPVRASMNFSRKPDKESLAQAIYDIADAGLSHTKGLLYVLPWQIASIVSEASDEQQLRKLAEDVQSGGKGDQEQWVDAEKRWTSKGIEKNDLLGLTSGFWFDANIHKVGAPYWIPWGRQNNPKRNYSDALRLFELSRLAKHKEMAQLLVRTAAINFMGPRHTISDPNLAESLLDLAIAQSETYMNCDLIISFEPRVWETHSIVKKLVGWTTSSSSEEDEEEIGEAYSAFVCAFNNFPEERELIHTIVYSLLNRDVSVSAESLAQIDASALTVCSTDSDRVKVAIEILRSTHGLNGNGLALPVAAQPISEDALKIVVAFLATDILPQEKKLALLSELIHATKNDPSGCWRLFIDALRRVLDARKSGLALRDTWAKLKLPPDSFDGLLVPN